MDLKTYQFPIELQTAASEETEALWPVKVGEIKVVDENICEITLIDRTDESAPADFGVLTAEDNNGVPWYLSFVKATRVDGSEATVSESSAPSSSPTTSSGTDENTTSSSGTTTSEPGSMWDGVDLPGDPNVETDKGDDLSDVDWK